MNGLERTSVFTHLHCSFRPLKYIKTPVTPTRARLYDVRIHFHSLTPTCNEMGGACGAYGGGERGAQGSGGET